MQLHTIGIDLGKTVFHLVGLNLRGEVVVRKKVSRKQLLHFTANLQVKLIGMEACGGSHFLGRALETCKQEKPSKAALLNRTSAQRIPSRPGAYAPTKAEYICADYPVTFVFRLRQSGGPYIPVCRLYGSNPERELVRASRCVKETHQIADVRGLQGRPRYAQLLRLIKHAGAMPPESGGKRNRGESFFARPEPGPNLCAFRHLAMASCAAALGKDALANQGRPSWLEVPQAREERPQVSHLVALKNRRRNAFFAGLTEHRGCVVPQNAGKLPRREWKITLWPQFRTHAATLPAYGMALYASALEHVPPPLCLAGYFPCGRRWLGSAEAHIGDQIIHLITGELGPLS